MHPRTVELLDFLDAQRTVLRTAVDSVPSALRERRPAEGRWSVAEIIEHLAIVEKRVAARIAASIGEARGLGLGAETSHAPILPTVDVPAIVNRGRKITAPEAIRPTATLTTDDAWRALEASGAIVRGVLSDADGLAIGMLAMPHPVLGTASLYQWFVFIGAHEARHAAQIAEVGEALAHA
jgi:hypothetical protein